MLLNPIQISQLGSEKLIPDNTDLIPFQQANGVNGRISRGNLVKGLAEAANASSGLLSVKTIFLSHFDTDIIDIYGHSLNSVGSPSLSATQKKLGSKSLYLPGNSYLTSPATPDFAINSDFAIECFVWLPSIYSSNDKYVNFITLEQGANSITVGKWRSGNRPHWYGDISGSTQITIDTTSAPSLDTWHHIAFVRQGMNLQLFIDGLRSNTLQMTSNIIFSGNFAITIGAAVPYVSSIPPMMGGYISEVRIRTASFPTPSLPYEL